MRALEGELLLSAWQRGREHLGPAQALALLEVAAPEIDSDTLGRLPLATCNSLLLTARTLTFGSRMESFALCPECGTQLELALDAHEIARDLKAPVAEHEEFFLEDDPQRVYRMRPVNTEDLMACMEATDEAEARSMLLARVLDLTDGELLRSEQSDMDCLTERFDAINSSAEIRLNLSCCACGATSVLDLDIARFLWQEVGNAARRLLREIHTLASVYGWSEISIATMAPARRAAYLELIGS